MLGKYVNLMKTFINNSTSNLFLAIIGIFYISFLIYFKIIFDVFLLIYLFVTAYCIGYLFPIKMRLIDKFLIRLALGLGSLGILIWLSILFVPVYKNVLYIIISLIFILLQVKNTKKIVSELDLIISSLLKSKFYLIIIIITFSFFYIIAACYPIYHSDALAKHITIPIKIISSGIWDYNVIESVHYGDFAILEHMFFVFLMSFKGGKSLTIFNFIISLFVLIILLRISTCFIKSNLLQIIIALIYLSTPMVFFVSTTLNVDILPIFFICTSLIYLNYFNGVKFINHLPYISLLFGFSCFAKQTVLPIIISLVIIILIKIIFVIIKKEIKLNRLLIISSVSILLFFLPFLPSCLIVYYKSGNPFFPFMNGIFKSIYYVSQNFQDFYVMVDHKLGFNVSSIISMIFNTGRNTEMVAGGIGYHLLLLFLLPLIYFFKRSKLLCIYSFIIIFSYFISIRTSYNIRYYLIIIILSIVLCSFILIYFTNFIKHRYLRLIILSAIASFLFFPNIFYLVKNSLICKAMLIPNKALVLNPNKSILKNINHLDTKVLSNNDTNRGTFKGKYYILNWYNTYYLNRINKNNITPEQFIKSFDYYLIDIRFPETAYFPPGTFSPDNPKIKNCLTLIKEDATHKLFKIINNDDFNSIIDNDQKIFNQKWPHTYMTR